MENKNDNEKDLKVLLTFLTETKEGKFVKVDDSSMPYVRVKEQRTDVGSEDFYIFSIR